MFSCLLFIIQTDILKCLSADPQDRLSSKELNEKMMILSIMYTGKTQEEAAVLALDGIGDLLTKMEDS